MLQKVVQHPCDLRHCSYEGSALVISRAALSSSVDRGKTTLLIILMAALWPLMSKQFVSVIIILHPLIKLGSIRFYSDIRPIVLLWKIT